MKAADLQVQLHQAIDAITDTAKLEAIYTLLEEANGPFKPMSPEEYVGFINESRQQIKDGRYLSADDLEIQSENW